MRPAGASEVSIVAETHLTPASSNIESFSFDPETDTLTVNFRSGDSYEYYNVPASVYRGFQSASSAGQFHSRAIKGRYAYEQI
jgi:lysyl-tRNA synthetase class 2